MDRIYEKANDQHVRGTYVYIKAGDAYAYADSACTVKISATDLKELFLKGIVLSDSGALSRPTGFSITTGVAALTYIKPNGSTATSADIATLYSKEYAEDLGD